MVSARRFLVVLGSTAVLLAPAAPAEAIIGGRTATAQDNPSHVGLVLKGERLPANPPFCGGTLVAPTVVVTAMHCLEIFGPDGPFTGNRARSLEVVGGAISLADPGMQRVGVDRLVKHPSYRRGRNTHDLLVVHLAVPLRIPPMPLAGAADAPLETAGARVSVTGWGLRGPSDSSGQPRTLKQADLRLRSGTGCRRVWGTDVDPAVQLCAGVSSGTPDTCRGDSGGGLSAGTATGQRLLGVVSFGPACGEQRDVPGVYGRVLGELDFLLPAAGLAPASSIPAGSPAARTPPRARNTVRVRLGEIRCEEETCRVGVRVSGPGRRDVRDVRLRVVRRTQGELPAANRTVRAVRVEPGAYRARTLLPLGRVRLSAVAYDRDGAQLGPAATETIEVVE